MNIMRKLLVGPPRHVPDETQQNAQHTALGLMHLKKLFAEYSHPQTPLLQKEQEDKLYNMLPLFCKVFGNSPARDMIEKFGDILAFCQQVSKLMVSEIRRRASNQSTEAASWAIVKFLEIESTEESSNGWMLLTSINLLASGDISLIEVMTAASLPSTLVKCLYLFFDLPEVQNADIQEPNSEFTARERRILLQKIFVQVLVRLCSHSAPAEELARKDDLTLLFSAITSWCPSHNIPWRKSAGEVLMTLSRHGLSQTVVNYIHSKGCVPLCIDNMQRVQELSPLEIMEMFVTVFCFLKDSSEVSQTLLDDFRSCQGYIFISEFLLRLDQDKSEEAQEALRNLVFMTASLSTCGFIELKPSQASMGSLFQIPGFQLPSPSGRGVSIRNIQAFQVLQTVFLRASSPYLSNIILDAISGIYHSDNANYFILEPQHTLSQFAEKIHTKTWDVQEKFFKLLEFIVFHLKFVPCKELISLSILLKTQSSVECSIICMKTLLNILKFNVVFKDVYREVGLLEVMVACLHRYAALLKEPHTGTNAEDIDDSSEIPNSLQKLGFLVMEALTLLLSNNSSNAGVFRECGGARCAHNMVPYVKCRQQALGIVQQLVLCNGGDDDMGTLLAMMHTAPVTALELKTHILKSLLFVLRESHRTRTVFRKVGGFVYVMSVLVSMEGCLADPPKAPWDSVERQQIMGILKTVFTTLTIAMRFEPANAKFFAQEICYTSLTDTIRLLGCFSESTKIKTIEENYIPTEGEMFHSIFIGNKEISNESDTIPRMLVMATMILRLLYDMALDAFDRSGVPVQSLVLSPALKRTHSESNRSGSSSPLLNKRSSVSTLNLTPPVPDPVIVYPNIVVGILHLLPAIELESAKQMGLTLQLYAAEVLRSLMRTERNQQVMCEAGMPSELLTYCSTALEDEAHFLHPPLQYMFERLAAQALEPKDLRDFIRLGYPLCCKPFESYKDDTDNNHRPICRKEGGPVQLTRVKTLVSMTTPRDFRMNGAALMPPFVEFEMNSEGFGCLYLPSIAPQSVSGSSVVGVGMVSGSSDSSVIGGIGTGDRIFPPQTGLTFSTWICVEKFSDPRQDPHSVRLLTLVRHLQGRDDHLICMTVLLSARDKALIISSQEILLPQTGPAEWEPEVSGDGCIRIWCPELLQEGQWHHIVLVLNRAVLKNSSASLYVDSQLVSTQKLHYISQNPGGGAANLTVAASVYAYIGTPPSWRRHSRLVWKQGPFLLMEDVLAAHGVETLYQLGPSYLGCLQAPVIYGSESPGALISEDKVIFGINALAMTQLTLARIRKIYSKTDSKSIARQLGMSSHENATPIRVLHNSAEHLSGPARSLGGVLIGYQGVRTFCPKPVAKVIENVGGCPSLLGLIAMASDVEGLYAAVKALVCVVQSNVSAQQEMDRIRGYQSLALLLKKKRALLNSHILHLTFSLVGTVDSGRESTVIPNPTAFQDLLSDLEVWREAPSELQRSLYEHFYELVTESSDQKNNIKIMRNLGMVSKLLHVLKDPTLPTSTMQIILNLLSALIHNIPNNQDLLRFGQFMAATLPVFSVSEKQLNLDESCDRRSICEDEPSSDFSNLISVQNILLRNRLLNLLYKIIYTNKKVNHVFSDEIMRVLGFDWLLLFLQGHLHSTTVVLALKILVSILYNPLLMQRFREGNTNGGWLRDTESVVENRMGVVLGFNVGTANSKLTGTREIREEAYHVPGFQMLQSLMPKHILIQEVYFYLLSLLLGREIHTLPNNLQLDLDSIWAYIFGVPACQSVSAVTSKLDICPDVVVVLLAMVRTMLNQVPSETSSIALNDFPVTLIQFLLFLYHNVTDFMPMCMTGDILCALASTLFPYHSSSDTGSEASSPTEEIKTYGAESIVVVKISDKHDQLTNHSARKFVMDFLRVIVVDSLSMPVSSKTPPVIDLLLEAMPIHANRSQQRNFQTEILSSLMDHLLAADILLGEQSALPIAAGGNYSYIAGNVFYLAGRIVDKLWQGIITRDSHEVFDFIIKLISQAKRRSAALSLDPIYRCLNRTILYQLSRPIDSVADQMSILEALHKLTSNRALIFGPNNYEQEFIACLCYCLLQLTEEITVSCDTNRRTVWHVNPNSSPKTLQAAQEGQSLLVTAAKRVWEELYVCKKPAIEEVFKVTIPSQNQTPDLQQVRDLIYDAASKIWLMYVEGEKRSNSKITSELQSQLQSKIQKVTGGLSRLASRKSRKEESVRIRWANVSMQDVQCWTFTHIAIVKDLVELQYKQLQQSHQHMQKYLFEEWVQIENELTRERGLWGPMIGSHLDKWMLDMTEGPCRMRKKMMRNDWFYIHYPYRPEIENGENKALKYKVATSYDSKEYYHQNRSTNLVEREALPYETGSLSEEAPTDSEVSEDTVSVNQLFRTPLLPRTAFNRTVSEIDDDSESFDTDINPESEEDDKPDNQTLLRLLEEDEKINYMFRCARIQGLDTNEGLLLFGKEHYYVVDGFTLLKSREIRDIDFLPVNLYEPIIPNTTNYRNKRGQKKMCSKFAYEDIREVHKRRYLLQPIALEVFSADGRNYLLAFSRGIRNKVYQRFMSVATAINDNAQQSVAGQKRTANVEQGAGILSSLIGETSVTQRWVRGEINNFQYLMHLNTLAGRSYNDLMQYPVFPWILADYDSEELDLTDPAAFRDFSKPMGAQSPERLKQFKKRYKEWDDPHGETPPYHYGTHYSSAMIVASYLVRMEPFTQHFLKLQGGHFDLADRMFHSVKEAWLSASKHNMADVKELIPEFFYLLEMLVNSNNFDLGCKQNGVQLGDVVLPPWAKGDPREFIRIHRLALECDYVSSHLHEWIDLIFGYKQQGSAAYEAVNVFHHLFYEGNVDIYSIEDPLKKNATIGFINNFGQIPKQLFKKPHPAKKLNRVGIVDSSAIPLGLSYSPDKLFFHNLDNLKPTLQPVKELKGPVGQIVPGEKSVIAVEQNKVIIPRSGTRYLAWGFADHSLRVGNYDSDKASFVYELSQCGDILCCACPNSKLIITGGTSTVVNVWEFGKRQLILKQNLYSHTEAVTCLAASPAYNLIVSGSRDRTCIIWDMSRLIFVRQLTNHVAPVAAVAINELTGDIASCAGTYLYLWSINGKPIANVNISTGRTDRLQQILCVAFSQLYEWDPLNVVMTGSSDGIVRMWSSDYVQVPIEDKEADKPVNFEKERENEPPEDIINDADSSEKVETQSTLNKAEDYVRKMSIATAQIEADNFCHLNLSTSGGNLAKSGSESSLSEDESGDAVKKGKTSGEKSQEQKKCQTDAEKICDSPNGKITKQSSSQSLNNGEQVESSSKTVLSTSSQDVVRRIHINGSASNHIHRSSTISTGEPAVQEKANMLRASKSDTSLTDSFVFINEPEPAENEKLPDAKTNPPANMSIKKNPNKLREGFEWKCQLIFRSKLTMHTAFDRKDNSEPANITAIAVSKDHKSVYVGDARGRVYSWSVTDHPGRVIADHWVKDEGGDNCVACGTKFTFSERRHHCRNCGQLFCSKCSRFESEISRLRILKPVRVCQACYNTLRAQQFSDNISTS